MKQWYVTQSSCGKYADGFYGWDSNIHCDEQIHDLDGSPYVASPTSSYKLVGVGLHDSKPSPDYVRKYLEKGYYPELDE